jgi:hypothetical protein
VLAKNIKRHPCFLLLHTSSILVCTSELNCLNCFHGELKGLLTNFLLNRSNFLGTKFTVYDAHPPYDGAAVSKSRSARVVGLKQVSPRVPAGNYPVSHISYELNVLGSRYGH